MATRFTHASVVPAPPALVWQRVTTPAGINDELFPWLRMTVPKALLGKTIEAMPLGPRLGRSWLLLLGVLPIDYDDLAIAALEPGRRFLERSSMLAVAEWEHERRLAADPGGCRVEDRIGFVLRAPMRFVPGLASLLSRALRALFAHRHRRLRRWCMREAASAVVSTK